MSKKSKRVGRPEKRLTERKVNCSLRIPYAFKQFLIDKYGSLQRRIDTLLLEDKKEYQKENDIWS